MTSSELEKIKKGDSDKADKKVQPSESIVPIKVGVGITLNIPGDPKTLPDATKAYLKDPFTGPIGH